MTIQELSALFLVMQLLMFSVYEAAEGGSPELSKVPNDN
jgi:hypothetical protein